LDKNCKRVCLAKAENQAEREKASLKHFWNQTSVAPKKLNIVF